jgi:replicative DNA helicase
MELDRHAERAVVGALLLEPQRYPEVGEWLEPEDFFGLAERRTYEAMRSLVDGGQDLTPSAVNEHLGEVHPERRHRPDAAFLVSCTQECPVPARVALYGRMVLDVSIRRHINARAAGLRQRAEQTVTSDDLNRVFGVVDSVRREVERLHQREAMAARAHAPTPLDVNKLPDLPTGSLRHDPSVESTAVLALVSQPLALPRVSTWLEKADFREPECALVYVELQSMMASREPIDPLTVAWRVSRRASSNRVVEALLGVQRAGPRLPDASVAARRVLEQSVRRALVDTSLALESLALGTAGKNPATAEAYARLNGLWPHQRRLIKAGLRPA